MVDQGFEPDDQQSGRPRKPQGGKGGPTPPPRMKMSRGVMSWVGFVLIALMIALVVSQGYQPAEPLSIDAFWKNLAADQFSEVVILDDAIAGKYRETAQGRPHGPRATNTFKVNYRADRVTELEEKIRKTSPSTKVNYEQSSAPYINMLLSIIPWILIFGFIWFFVFRQLRSSAGGAGMLGNFGRSRHRVSNKELVSITFKDVAGVEEAKEEVTEIIEFLKNPKKFQRLGGRIPRGVLLVGEPGCGKTLLAKAIAGEADVPFFSISGADFVEMFVGVGASRVRDLFKSAKENSPCIIFLDEIDAVGRKRGAAYNGGGHDEREQTLNAILVEMDGFDTSDQVIVIAATNRDDILDPALTRPGRFDRRVFVPLPDVKGRLEILKVHARKIKLSPSVDLMRVARATPMFSGAELAAVINEAAILATMQNKDMVELEDLEEGRDKVRYGRSNKSRQIEERERVNTAYHEAGHAVLQMMLQPDCDPLHKVTIIPRGRAMGSTMSLPDKDRYGFGSKWLFATMRVLCGGRIAEMRPSGEVSSGAAMDIEQMTRMARTMVVEWGMSDKLGFVRYSPDTGRESFFPEKSYSDETAKVIDDEIKRFADEAYRDAERMLNESWPKVQAVAEALLKYETLDGDEVRRLCLGEVLDKPSLSGLLADQGVPPKPPVARPVSQRPNTDIPGGLSGGSMPQPGIG
ncbi:MAG: ATP-dependent zinc metalloprotease FtsH [Planctomycetes bacterium]|nr:ATP-dependent zinc metalloprotease FtsH [Planctomycetota bacterium]